MPKDEWGVKRVCPSCSTRFYDLRADPMTCPSCGASFTVESLAAAKPKALRPEKVKPEEAETPEVTAMPASEETIEEDDELEDEILEDDDDNVDLDEIADVASDDNDD